MATTFLMHGCQRFPECGHKKLMTHAKIEYGRLQYVQLHVRK